ncbi:uncharacterized protein BX664DRAFT_328856 [Halteromyces radiatus]|uniref:uncharacterized protein n=1 Tax=Halteromyces radiatus TaxID=101107 RepID=UPI00221E8994|nr:uncharacterized protein BX664DRAFT_328856 [Halteromyces radiatus]KAI8093071.1 hypothetical protein BX664DRAFT_328856 [Halteromyces radiatus]
MSQRIFIGNLSRSAEKKDLDRMFSPFGPILDLTVKSGFGFVEFESSRDAAAAVEECNGAKIHDRRIIVEIAARRRDRREPYRRESESYRLIVKDIPPNTTWQDLKDLMKKAGRVTFADILKNTDEGIVEFAHRSDMQYALRKLDNSRLNGQRITLEEPSRRRRRSSRDRSISRSPSRSRSPRRGRSYRSRSRSSSSRYRSASDSSRRSRSRSVSSGRHRSASPRRSVSPARSNRSQSPDPVDAE